MGSVGCGLFNLLTLIKNNRWKEGEKSQINDTMKWNQTKLYPITYDDPHKSILCVRAMRFTTTQTIENNMCDPLGRCAACTHINHHDEISTIFWKDDCSFCLFGLGIKYQEYSTGANRHTCSFGS